MQDNNNQVSTNSPEYWRQEALRWQRLAQKRSRLLTILNIVLWAIIVISVGAIVALLAAWGLPGYVP